MGCRERLIGSRQPLRLTAVSVLSPRALLTRKRSPRYVGWSFQGSRCSVAVMEGRIVAHDLAPGLRGEAATSMMSRAPSTLGTTLPPAATTRRAYIPTPPSHPTRPSEQLEHGGRPAGGALYLFFPRSGCRNKGLRVHRAARCSTWRGRRRDSRQGTHAQMARRPLPCAVGRRQKARRNRH